MELCNDVNIHQKGENESMQISPPHLMAVKRETSKVRKKNKENYEFL